jgi:5'-deoxynucleotidase YfbR-like HD superfamily hydrolase
MFKLDDNLLRELGLGDLPPQEKNRMLQHIYETLEMRVGMRLAEGMSNQQLDEFEKLMPTQTDTDEMRKQKEQDALRWLETNFPNYKQVVADELEKLKGEIKIAAPQILAASQQPPQQPPLPPQPGQQPPMAA